MFNIENYVNDIAPDSDPFKIKDYEEWLMEYDELKAEGKKLWKESGLPDDIRKGWQEAAKENKLFSCGPYEVPLDLVEQIEADTEHLLRLAQVHKKKKDKVDPYYLGELKARIKQLEEDNRNKDKKIDMLLNMIAEIRLERQKAAHEAYDDEKKLSGVDDEIELY